MQLRISFLLITGQVFLSGFSRVFEYKLHPLYQFTQKRATAFLRGWANPKPLEIYLAVFVLKRIQKRGVKTEIKAINSHFFVFEHGKITDKAEKRMIIFLQRCLPLKQLEGI